MSENTCLSCGAPAPTGAKFCTVCGAKITEAPEPALLVAATPAAAQSQPQPQIQYQQSAAKTSQIEPQFHAQSAQSVLPTTALPVPEAKPMSLVGYLLTMLVFAVPAVGLALALMWALGKNTGQNRKNLALAQLIVWGILFAAVLVWYFVNFSAINELIKVILS